MLAERDALEALAVVLAPRVLRVLHAHVVEMASYEDALGLKICAELGYVVDEPERDPGEALIQMLAREAVRAVKAQYATGPDFDDEMTPADSSPAQLSSTKSCLTDHLPEACTKSQAPRLARCITRPS